jgi:hypothetical protein
MWRMSSATALPVRWSTNVLIDLCKCDDLVFSRSLIKEFDRILKEDEKKNSADVNKQLNDKKQLMVGSTSFLH